jgi:hypothetical protein
MDTKMKYVVDVLQQILDGKTHPIEACRIVVSLRRSFPDPQDSDLLILVGIESETDDLPVGEVRDRWAPDVLARKDVEMKEYLTRVEETLLNACRNLVRKSETW